jgi:hypothetical protein
MNDRIIAAIGLWWPRGTGSGRAGRLQPLAGSAPAPHGHRGPTGAFIRSAPAAGPARCSRGVGTVVVVGPQAVDAQVVPARARVRGHARAGGAGGARQGFARLGSPRRLVLAVLVVAVAGAPLPAAHGSGTGRKCAMVQTQQASWGGCTRRLALQSRKSQSRLAASGCALAQQAQQLHFLRLPWFAWPGLLARQYSDMQLRTAGARAPASYATS